MRRRVTPVAGRTQRPGRGSRGALIPASARLTVIPALIGVTVLVFVPMAASFWQSLHASGSGFGGGERFVGPGNYERMAADGSLWLLVANSALWTLLVVVGQNVLGFFAALLMAPSWRLSGVLRSLLMLPWVLPGVVAAVLWGLLYNPQLGMLPSLLTRIVGPEAGQVAPLSDTSTAMAAISAAAVWKGFPFSFTIYLAALTTVDRHLVDAAKLDGAGHAGVLRHVVLPAIRPVAEMTLLLTSVFTFNYFDMIWVTTKGGPLDSTHIFPTLIFETGFGKFNFGLASAYGVVAFLLMLLLLIPYLRRTWTSEKDLS